MVGRIITRDILPQAGAAVSFIDQILNTIIERNNPPNQTPSTVVELLASANATSTCADRLNKGE